MHTHFVCKALRLLVTLSLLAAVASAQDKTAKKQKPQRRANPVMDPIKENPKLPNVLLIGDSISIGYTLPTRKLLEGKANVHRIPTNDLHAFALKQLSKIQQPKNVHFSGEGSAILAKEVARQISEALDAK